ncbi:hypothetical protein NL676_021670 [Syzygium grande]|nr:hypothetical protein NL676_021670 [Syzygium grande]
MPSEAFAGLTSLQTLSLSKNFDLDPWPITSKLNWSASLVTFYAGNANVMGPLPDFFGSFPSLQSLRLMPQLSQVWSHKNRFTGPIPDLSKCESLFDLQLRNNQLTGVVPANLMSLPSLKNVSLDNNKLQGPVPDNPNNIQFTYDSTNSFCNTAPGPCAPQVTTLLEIAGALGYPMTLADSWEGNDACQGWSSIACQGKNNKSYMPDKIERKPSTPSALHSLSILKEIAISSNYISLVRTQAIIMDLLYSHKANDLLLMEAG